MSNESTGTPSASGEEQKEYQYINLNMHTIAGMESDAHAFFTELYERRSQGAPLKRRWEKIENKRTYGIHAVTATDNPRYANWLASLARAGLFFLKDVKQLPGRDNLQEHRELLRQLLEINSITADLLRRLLESPTDTKSA
ncbi:hypothetical protein A3D88_03400 [Candidatus Peribacteria bacterium RIFCSPHIGHO2_02_FULL_52_16]|nr:MAG: hypothetical protein A2706_04215 [Candidatus Peribacteria bacterium RIFCSPHIGHO2_01_FULL_51_35]OGJ61734.1 MAG: hypothetical protein A3D88_03400 [Candidatus Peribacteria bacterium RIFCSPHIGHO2_02_FULL_52_16]